MLGAEAGIAGRGAEAAARVSSAEILIAG